MMAILKRSWRAPKIRQASINIYFVRHLIWRKAIDLRHKSDTVSYEHYVMCVCIVIYSLKSTFKQECIPVGCILLTH